MRIGRRTGMALGAALFGAKGDTIVALAAGQAGIRSAPADGKQHVADSSQATGWNAGYPATVYSQCGQLAAINPVTGSDTSLFSSLLALPTRIAAGDRIDIEVVWTLNNSSSATRVYTPNIKIGATTVHNAALATLANNATTRVARLALSILCTATNAQRILTMLDVGAANNTSSLFGNVGGQSVTTAAEDLTAGKNFDFLIQSSASTATQTAQIEQATIRHMPLKTA